MNKEDIDRWDDPIVKEVREARDAFARKFNYDVDAIFNYLKEMEVEGKTQGRAYINRLPKRSELPKFRHK